MAYCAQTDIEKLLTPAQLVQLTDDDANGVADAAPITEAIAQADAEIDGYLGSRYTVPVSPVPTLLRNLSVAISIWKIYGRRSVSNERRRQEYEDAVAKLRDLAAGRMVLPAAGGGEVASDGSDLPEASTVESDRLFTRGKASDGSSGTLDNF
jgi:phage gp36-like protein